MRPKPEAHRRTVFNRKMNKRAKGVPKSAQGAPKLGSSRSRREERRRVREVFSLQKLKPEGVRAARANFPPPFRNEAVIHNRSIDDAQSPHALGEAR